MSATTILDGWITRHEAAQQLGCSWRTLCRWESLPDGLPGAIIAGRKYYRIEALRDFIAQRERKPNPRRNR